MSRNLSIVPELENHIIAQHIKPKALPIGANSAWKDSKAFKAFLQDYTGPMRIAFHDGSAFPRVCSLWFIFLEKRQSLIAVSHKNAFINKCLRANPNVGFEIGTNEPPYKGVRGQATTSISQKLGETFLPTLLDDFLDEDYPELRPWLEKRAHDEEAIILNIESINAWDYSFRM